MGLEDSQHVLPGIYALPIRKNRTGISITCSRQPPSTALAGRWSLSTMNVIGLPHLMSSAVDGHAALALLTVIVKVT
jgi:hypothetical protein